MLKHADRVLLLLDYDGTLTPIVSRPELAKLSDEMRNVLRLVSARYKTVIITGRASKDIKKLVKIKNIYYSSNHGMMITGPRIRFIHSKALKIRPSIKRICLQLKKKLKIRGTIVEDKDLTIGVHYRLAKKRDLPKIKKNFYEVVKPHKDVKITKGKKVLEVRPRVEWDKGKAVKWILKLIYDKKNVLPIYIGDDETDEDAFRILKDNSITVFVISKEKKVSNARYYLKSVAEVKKFFEKLI